MFISISNTREHQWSVSFDFVKSLNGILPSDIAVHDARMVSSDFSARFNAISRTYEYHIIFEKDPFLDHLAVRWFHDLNVDAMNQACLDLIGDKDFACFSKVNTDVKHYNCNLMAAKGLGLFPINENRGRGCFARARQTDADVGVFAFTRTIHDATHDGQF